MVGQVKKRTYVRNSSHSSRHAPEPEIPGKMDLMCGRIALFTPPAHLARFLDAALAAGIDPEEPSWNVGPQRTLFAVAERHDERQDQRGGRDGRPRNAIAIQKLHFLPLLFCQFIIDRIYFPAAGTLPQKFGTASRSTP